MTDVNEFLESFYRGSGMFYGFKCSNRDCLVKEGPDTTLSWCKGCNAVLYCGKECQKADWKRHKRDCKTNKNDLRACTFMDKYEELLPKLLFAGLHDRNGEWKGEELAVYVELQDLPSSFERPNYEIKEVVVEPIDFSDSIIAARVRSTREKGAMTFQHPSSRPGHDFDMFTEWFDIGHIFREVEVFERSRDPNYWKNFINQLARRSTPLPG